MNFQKLLAPTLGTVLLVGGVVLWARTQHPTKEALHAPVVASAATPEQVQQLAGELAALRSELANVRQNAPAQQPAAVPQGSAAIAAQDPPPPTTEEAQRMALVELEARVETEVVDRAWSIPTEQQIDSVFRSNTVPGSHALSVKCASSLCRVALRHDTDKDRDALATEIASTAPFEYGTYYARSETSLETVLYVMRPGATL